MRRIADRSCRVPGCCRPMVARQLCGAHYQAMKRGHNLCLPLPSQRAERFWLYVHKADGCWEWAGRLNPGGYGVFCALGERLAHRVSYVLANGPILGGLVVRHACDNRKCVRPDHLSVGSKADNVRDMDARNRRATGDRHPSRIHPERFPRGEAHWKAKLTDHDVREIRSLFAAGGRSKVSIAIQYGVSSGTVSQIILGRIWRHCNAHRAVVA